MHGVAPAAAIWLIVWPAAHKAAQYRARLHREIARTRSKKERGANHLFHGRAYYAGVLIDARISARHLLVRMGEGALVPVVIAWLGASDNLPNSHKAPLETRLRMHWKIPNLWNTIGLMSVLHIRGQ
jgi:hypothetical protein